MEGFDLKKMSAEVRAAGLDPTDLEKVANYFMQKSDRVEEVTFSSPVRNIKGLTVPVLIRTAEEKKNDGPNGNGKTRIVYRLMVCTFEDVVVPSELGEKIHENEIQLRVEKKIKMSQERRDQYLASLSPAERNGFAGKREYDTSYDEKVTLFAGTEIQITRFDGPFTHSNNMPFEAGEFAICKGLICEEKFMGAGESSRYGRQWKVQDKVGKLEEDLTKGPDDVRRMLRLLARDNQLVNVGDVNPDFSKNNETPVDRKFRTEAEASGKELKNWQKSQILLGFLPLEQRPATERVIVIPLGGTEPTPEFMAQRKKVVVKEPVWSTEFVGTKNDGKPVKLGTFKARCCIIDGDQETEAVVQVQCFDKHMVKFGVMNYDLFGKIAGSYVPHCRGHIAGRMDIGSSHAMDESSTAYNRRNEDGSYPKGAAFGVFAYAELLDIDLASGIVKGGFGPLTASCAAAAIEQKYKSSDFSERAPADVESYAKINPLNTGGKPAIINMFEARHSVEDIKKTHQFFLVCDKRNDSDEVTELVGELQRKHADSIVDRMSDLLMGHSVKGITGWPVKIRALEAYTIFAVRNSLVESTMKLLDGGSALSQEEFLKQYIAAVQKRKASEAKAEQLRRELEGIATLPAEAFEDSPAKRQKVDPEPAAEDEQSNNAADEEEQEISASQRPKTSRRHASKKKAKKPAAQDNDF